MSMKAKTNPMAVTGAAARKTTWNDCTNACKTLCCRVGEKVFKIAELFWISANFCGVAPAIAAGSVAAVFWIASGK